MTDKKKNAKKTKAESVTKTSVVAKKKIKTKKKATVKKKTSVKKITAKNVVSKSKSKPSVAILHYSCPPVIGGVEFIILAHALEFVKAGFKTKVIVGKGGKLSPDVTTEVIPELMSTGGPVSRVLKSLGEGTVPKNFDELVKRVEKKLEAALKDVDVCMIHNVMTMHFNLVMTAALANIAKRNKKIRFIAWTHDLTFGDPVYDIHQHRRYPWSLLSQPIEGVNYCAISGSRQHDMNKLFRIPKEMIPVIPDGIDVPKQLGLTKSVEKLFHDENLANVDIVAITPARIMRRKNLGVGMEIVAAIKEQGKSVRWLITGAPDPHNPDSMKYYRMLRLLRSQLNVTKEVVFLCDKFDKHVSGVDLRCLYRVCDMLLFPSDREGFGLPVLEAGLAALLTVISDIPVLRELAGQDAVFIRLGDSAEMIAKNIITAIDKRPELRNRKDVISTFAWSVVFNEKIMPAIMKPNTVWGGK